MIEEMQLMDYLGEEVVDKDGIAVGTLSCFWEVAPRRPAFYGVKYSGQSLVRVVPVRFSRLDERHSCIRLGFDGRTVEEAPGWDCSMELDAPLQDKVNSHFGLDGADRHTGLKYYSKTVRGSAGEGICGDGPSSCGKA